MATKNKLSAPVPYTVIQQALSCLVYPPLINASNDFETLSIDKAHQVLNRCKPGIGAYSTSQGLPLLTEYTADFFCRRDGFKADPRCIFLTAGYRDAIQLILTLLLSSTSDGVIMCTPVPTEVPLLIQRKHGKCLYVPLDTSGGESLFFDEKVATSRLHHFLSGGENRSCRSVFVVDAFPNDEEGMAIRKNIVSFCNNNGCLLIVDESFQTTKTHNEGFISLRKLVSTLEDPFEVFSIISFDRLHMNSVVDSAAIIADNVTEEVFAVLRKLASIQLCSVVAGQATLALYLNDLFRYPPPIDAPLLAKAEKELTQKRQFVTQFWKRSSRDGFRVQCAPVPPTCIARLTVKAPLSFFEAAKKLNEKPDVLLVRKAEFQTGLSLVPGSSAWRLPKKDNDLIIYVDLRRMTLKRLPKALSKLGNALLYTLAKPE